MRNMGDKNAYLLCYIEGRQTDVSCSAVYKILAVFTAVFTAVGLETG